SPTRNFFPHREQSKAITATSVLRGNGPLGRPRHPRQGVDLPGERKGPTALPPALSGGKGTLSSRSQVGLTTERARFSNVTGTVVGGRLANSSGESWRQVSQLAEKDRQVSQLAATIGRPAPEPGP